MIGDEKIGDGKAGYFDIGADKNKIGIELFIFKLIPGDFISGGGDVKLFD